MSIFFFFFNDTATTEIYTLSLHDALPIYDRQPRAWGPANRRVRSDPKHDSARRPLDDRGRDSREDSARPYEPKETCLRIGIHGDLVLPSLSEQLLSQAAADTAAAMLMEARGLLLRGWSKGAQARDGRGHIVNAWRGDAASWSLVGAL